MRRNIGLTVLAGIFAAAAKADVGPPVTITMPRDRAQAVSGQEYAGEFLVQVFEPGVLTGFQLVGEGWTVTSFDPPATPLKTVPGLIRIPFRAVPADADEPFGLRVAFNGWPTQRQYRVGPETFARRAQPRRLVPVQSTGGQATPVDVNGRGDGAGGAPVLRGGNTIVVAGRIVYNRPGNDDVPPMVVGADNILVQLWDVDPITDELMWSGRTTEEGYFVTPPLDADVDGDGSGPDLVLRVEAEWFYTGEGVYNPDEDELYWWQTEEIVDYEHDYLNYGTLMSLNPDDHAAFHIFNSIVRSFRFISEKAGYGTPTVRVVWPVEEWSHYKSGVQEIHLFNGHSWSEDTAVHEFGHHFIYSIHTPPPPDYANGICDEGTPEGDCFPEGQTWSPGPGHCAWCQENAFDAWNEGWPNWLADAVLRDFPDRYVLDLGGGPPYEALNRRSYETPRNCCVDGMAHDPLTTEGFVAALLRDIDDDTQDDHDADGVFDLLCVGPAPILHVLVNRQPVTVLQFIDGFLSDYPEHAVNLYPTAFNVGGAAYVAGFPSDTQPPGVVPAMDSKTHPIGVGGSLPCIRFQFDPAPDDASGCTAYSYAWGDSPAGFDPGNTPNPVTPTDNCRLEGIAPAFELGDHYVSIKAQDNAGNWSSDFVVFGPFTIVDCNGSGFLDACDIRCCDPGDPDCQFVGTDTCSAGATVICQATCGISQDCNGNFIPDECDIASGFSEDCNRDGIPDECQTDIIKHFVGASSGNWNNPDDWLEEQVPAIGDHVCVPWDIPAGAVTLSSGQPQISTLNCESSLSMGGSAELRIDEDSYILGNLTLSGSSSLRVMDVLNVEGALNWASGRIEGTGGTTTVTGGMNLTSATVNLGPNHHLIISGGSANAGSRLMNLFSGAVLTIGPGVTYDYSGDFRIFDGGTSTTIDIDGTLLCDPGAGDGDTQIYSYFDNSGLIQLESGELYMSYGGTSTGDVLGDTGTTLTFANGTYDFLPGSSLTGNDVRFYGGGTFQGALNVADTLTINGGPVTFTDQAAVTSYGSHLFARSGTVHFQSPAAPAIDFDSVIVGEGNPYCGNPHFDTGETFVINTLQLVCGTIRGADPITINDSFTWGGGGSFFSGGAVTCLGPVTIQATSSQRNLSRLLYNTAHATFLGSFTPSGSGRFINTATGTVDLQGNVGLTGGQSINDGTITKTAGTGRSWLAGMTNNGLIHAQTGEIYFYFGGQNNGSILGDPGTLLSFNHVHEMMPGSSLTADNVDFTGLASTIRGDVNITGTLSLGNSSTGGSATFTNEANVTGYGHTVLVRSGTVRFEAPVDGPSLDFDTVTLGEGNTNGQTYFDTGQPVNIGTLNLMRGNIQGADPITIHDAFTWGPVGSMFAGGTFTCLAPWTLQASSSQRSIARDFVNHGYGSLFGPVNLSSGADFINEPGGTVDFKTDAGGFGLTLTSHIQNNGVIVKSGGTGDSPISTHFTNAGTLEILTGRVVFQASYTLNFIQTAGATLLNGGDLATLGNPYNIQGGDLAGIGTVLGEVNNSGGQVTPGLSAGTLEITGNYTQGSEGRLEIELGGLDPGQFDVLTVGGTASLAGELHITTIDGYTPASGDTFVVLSAGVRTGAFAAVTGLSGLDVSYTPTQVIVTVASAPCTEDIDGDGSVGLGDLSVVLTNFGTAGGATHAMGDINGDGNVDLADLSLLLEAFGTDC